MQLELPAPHVTGGSMPGLRTPISFSRATLNTGRPAPRLGEHTAALRQAYGLSGGE
jgi:crotonobetainyl-CoA:carnitine CoA-transferase CaiB-like acyl-CoA transferase